MLKHLLPLRGALYSNTCAPQGCGPTRTMLYVRARAEFVVLRSNTTHISRARHAHHGGTAPSIRAPHEALIFTPVRGNAPSLLSPPRRGVEIRAVAFQGRGPPGPYPSVVTLGGVGERAPPLTLVLSPPSPLGRSGGESTYVFL